MGHLNLRLGEDPESEDLIESVEESIVDYGDFLLEELENMLKEAVENENYEDASKLRDEINKRKNK